MSPYVKGPHGRLVEISDERAAANERVEAWWKDRGEFPYLVLGWRDDRGRFVCLDHPRMKRSKSPVFTSESGHDGLRCAVCGRHPRLAEGFGALSEADVSVVAPAEQAGLDKPQSGAGGEHGPV